MQLVGVCVLPLVCDINTVVDYLADNVVVAAVSLHNLVRFAENYLFAGALVAVVPAVVAFVGSLLAALALILEACRQAFAWFR